MTFSLSLDRQRVCGVARGGKVKNIKSACFVYLYQAAINTFHLLLHEDFPIMGFMLYNTTAVCVIMSYKNASKSLMQHIENFSMK